MMTFRYPSDEKIQRFWQWFEQNRSLLENLAQTDQAQAEKKIDARLKSLNRLLIPYISYNPDLKEYTFILSADGIEQVFPAVESIMQKAPLWNNWKFIAFRQPQPIDQTFTVDNRTFSINDFFFIPTENNNKTDLKILVKNYSDQIYYSLLNTIFKIINSLLGEYITVKYVGNVSLEPFNGQSNALPLSKLSETFKNLNQ